MSNIIEGITKDLTEIPKNLKAKAGGMDTKKLVLLNLPYIFAGYFCDKVAWLWRVSEGTNASDNEYYGAAEPPVRCGESHLSGLTEPPHFFIKLLCHCWVQSIYFSHREVFSWVNTFNIDLIGIIRYAIHDGIGKSTFTITDLLVPLTFTELRTKDC